MSNALAKFLNEKYREQWNANAGNYTVKKFAAELGIKYTTLNHMMNEKVVAKTIHFDNLQRLAKIYGSELLQVLKLI